MPLEGRFLVEDNIVRFEWGFICGGFGIAPSGTGYFPSDEVGVVFTLPFTAADVEGNGHGIALLEVSDKLHLLFHALKIHLLFKLTVFGG